MTTNTAEEGKLTALVNLLSCDELDAPATSSIVTLCLSARNDPVKILKDNYGADSAQIVQYDSDGVIAFIIFVELEGYFAVSDTVDEMHEQLIDAFEQPALPDFPYDDNSFETVSDYYQWLDKQLLIHHPKYRLIRFGQSYTHDFQVILVHRHETATILELCRDLAIDAGPCD